jgi:hypothetical protein
MSVTRRAATATGRSLTITGLPGQGEPRPRAMKATRTHVIKPLRLEDGVDLDERYIPPTRWTIEGILPEGLNMLIGKPKLGKSLLALQWALDIVNGRLVFGQHSVIPGEVLYLNLDDPNQARLQERQRAMMDGTRQRGLLWCYEAPPLSQGLLGSLDQALEQYPGIRTVIIDTWARVSKSHDQGADWYKQDVTELGELSKWAYEHRLTVLLIHHQRKGRTEDIIDSALGSTGVGGTIDSMLAFLRPNRGTRTATLSGLGRSFKEDLSINIRQQENGAWALQGRGYSGLTPEKQAIVTLLREKGPLAAKAIADALEKGLDGIQKHLTELRAVGWVIPVGAGKDTAWKVAVTDWKIDINDMAELPFTAV